MERLRKALIVSLVLLLLSSFSVFALTSWTRTIRWKMQGSFEVYGDASMTTPLDTEITFNITGYVSYSDVKTITYWIRNEGNVDITVSITDSGQTLVSASWDKASLPLAVGTYGTLTLTLTEFKDDGSYQFTFGLA